MSTQYSLLEILERPTLEALVKPDQIYNSDDWEFIVSVSEDPRFDRKSGKVQSLDLAECLSAFGNGPAVEGGVVGIGIEDKRKVTGCKSLSEEKISQLQYMGRDHCPDGRFVTRKVACKNYKGEDDFIILARVYYVDDRLVELTNGHAYCRESDRSRRLLAVEKDEIRINKGERQFELEQSSLKYPEDFRESEMTRFAKVIRTRREGSPEISDYAIFESMRLGKVRDSKFLPNNVCTWLFARDPQLAFPGAYVHFLRYDGKEEKSGKNYNVTKDRIISGTILEIIKDTANVIDANLREWTTRRGGKFFTVPEYPRDAWYEMVVNACVHRSYNARTQPIFVKLFDDHFVVENPGGFMPTITPENFFHKPRNPFLMLALREFGEVKCISEGTARIRREIKDAHLPEPIFSGSPSSVRVTLQNDIVNRTNSLDSEAYKALGAALAFSLDPDERKMINFVMENGKVNVSDALRLLNTTRWGTGKAKLDRLVSRGVLEFISSKTRDPNSFYRLARPGIAVSVEIGEPT